MPSLDGTIRASLRAGVAALAGASLLLPASARAAECPTADAVCVVDPTDADAVEEAGTAVGVDAAGSVADVTDAVAQVEDDVSDAVDAAVSEVRGTGDDVVRDVTRVVDDVRRVVDDPTASGPGASPGPNGDPGGSPGTAAGPDVRAGSQLRAPAGQAGRALGLRLGAGAPTSSAGVSAGAQLIGPSLIRRGDAAASLGSSAARIAAEVAKALAFPIALLLLVLGFVLVQHRIDRHEPKLSIAPVDTDRIPFS